jgi:ribosome-associated toxin RatA of RatAB toxin-antitoxin module
MIVSSPDSNSKGSRGQIYEIIAHSIDYIIRNAQWDNTSNNFTNAMTRDFILLKMVMVLVLLGGCFDTGRSQNQKDTQQLQHGIMKYPFKIMETPADTIAVDDSARVKLELALDCTNQITRFETIFDTTGDQQKVTLAIYGTYVSGPFRPLCPAQVVDKDFFIHFPTPGDWVVDSGQPDEETREPAIIVVR